MLKDFNLSRIDLNLLVVFEAVYDERHVGRAADWLNLTPSAVSHRLGHLRRQMNDPLFLRTPKGVIPTDRANALAAPIGEVLGLARSILTSALPFDPATSTRRFVIGAPDGVAATMLPRLLARLNSQAPGIDVGLLQVMPSAGEPSPDRAWRQVLFDLEQRLLDIAIIPAGPLPLRFASALLYHEDFVIAARAGHPFTATPNLQAYVGASHLVASASSDPSGFVDTALARLGFTRRIALTVPNFMLALAVLAETDLVAAIPRRFAALHATRFGLVTVEPPLTLPSFGLNAVLPRAALLDAGTAWIFGQLSGP